MDNLPGCSTKNQKGGLYGHNEACKTTSFAAQIEGDIFFSSIFDGEIVLYTPKKKYAPGELILIEVKETGNVYVGAYFLGPDGQIHLKAINTAVSITDLFFFPSEISILGAMISHSYYHID